MAAWNSSEIRLAELRRRWEQSPRSHLFLQLAEEYRRRGDTAQALLILRQGIEERPSVAAEVALGRCLLDAREPGLAATNLEKVVKRDPTQMVAYRHLIEAHLQLGNGQEAARCLEIYRQLNARDIDLLVLSERVETLLAPVIQEQRTTAIAALARPVPAALDREVEVIRLPAVPPAALPAVPPAANKSSAFVSHSEAGSFSGLWKSEAVPEAGRDAELGRGVAPAGAEIEVIKKPSPLVDAPMSGSRVRLATVEVPHEHPPLPLKSGQHLFELPSAPARSFDLAALPLRPLRFARVPRRLSTAALTTEIVESTSVETEPAVAESERTADASLAADRHGAFGPTATLGQMYLEQGHAEDAARIYSEVGGQSEVGVVHSDELSQRPPPAAPLTLAELLPLRLVRSRGSSEERRLLVVGAYLDKLKEAKRRVS